ncbi:MAG TPA: polyprenyl synthetase family protein [Pseudomonadota bacterium]|nr:polyprenyl synthetase family protein [Pseudomonadota bacterium]
MFGAVSPAQKIDPVEEALLALLPQKEDPPETLHRAMHHAVFSGGKRIRPRLLLTVASACAADDAELDLAMRAGCAIEFIHSASLVHDDLPCFDDADVRRGKPTVHKLFGEPMAVLAGDALLTRAFEVLADAPSRLARRALRIVGLLGQATGSKEGIIGGQSLEQHGLDGSILDRYHAMKTAALFRLAASAGAVAAGATDAEGWGEVGHCLGLAYQLADDLCDAVSSPDIAGKPVRRDETLGRPNAALLSGEGQTKQRLVAFVLRAQARTRELAADPKPLLDLIEELSNHFLKTTHKTAPAG